MTGPLVLEPWQAVAAPVVAIVSFAALVWRTWVVPIRREQAAEREERKEIAIWRDRVDRQFVSIDERMARHEAHDDRLYATLDTIRDTIRLELQSISNRLSNIEGQLRK